LQFPGCTNSSLPEVFFSVPTPTPTQSLSARDIGAIVGIIVLVFLIFAILLLLYYRKHQKKKEEEESFSLM